ncbi:MAG: peptidylprolyl isomerase [Candidatus Methanofastidiosia archaeon]
MVKKRVRKRKPRKKKTEREFEKKEEKPFNSIKNIKNKKLLLIFGVFILLTFAGFTYFRGQKTTSSFVFFKDSQGVEKGEFFIGEEIFIEVEDLDKNKNSSSAENISVSLSVPQTGDLEVLSLSETSKDTGVFESSIASVFTLEGVSNNGMLEVVGESHVILTYIDEKDPQDVSRKEALIKLPSTKSQIRFIDEKGEERDFYPIGQEIFVQVSDFDENQNPEVSEEIEVIIYYMDTLDSEIIELLEVGPNAGIFVSKGILSALSQEGFLNNGTLEVSEQDEILVRYLDKDDPRDFSVDVTLVAKSEKPKPSKRFAIIQTNLGTIKVELFYDKAPLTTFNFTELARRGFYDGTIFHRVIKEFIIQGGGFEPGMVSRESPFGAILLEINPELKHVDGALGMARAQDPNSATSQFYICDSAQPSLDGNYAVFGRVVEGMDVVRLIASVETGTLNEFSDVPLGEVLIISITIVES